MKLSDFIVEDAIIAELQASDRNGAIRELMAALGGSLGMAPEVIEAVAQSAIEREKLGSTGFGKGVAVPHVKHPGATRLAGAIGRSSKGIDFAALDRAPVYVIFLLLSPGDKPDVHLASMEIIFRHLQRDNFRKFLRQASTRQEIKELIQEADELAGG